MVVGADIKSEKKEKFPFSLDKLTSLLDTNDLIGELELGLFEADHNHFYLGLTFDGKNDSRKGKFIYPLAGGFKFDTQEEREKALEEAIKVYDNYVQALRDGNYLIKFTIDPLSYENKVEFEIKQE